MLDKDGKQRLEYMFEIGDGKGDFPPTPNQNIMPKIGYSSYHKRQSSEIPNEALSFAQKMLKNFLLSMTEQEADQLSKAIVNKWDQESRRVNDMMNSKLDDSNFIDNDIEAGINVYNSNKRDAMDKNNKTRRRRQERLTEINQLIKQKSYSPDNSILANIKALDEKYQKMKNATINQPRLKVKSRQGDQSPQSNGSRNTFSLNPSNVKGRERYFSQYIPNQSQLKAYIHATQFDPQPRDLQKELSSIMDDHSTLFKDNSMSFLSKNNTQALIGIQHNFEFSVNNNLGQQSTKAFQNQQVLGALSPVKRSPLLRYASRDHIDKDYDSIKSGYNSQERFNTEAISINQNLPSQKPLASVSSLQELVDEGRQKQGYNRINLKEFREKMIQNGFKRPAFFVRTDQGIPKPVSKLHERLYQEKQQKEELIKKKRDKYEQEKLKECTFAPQVNKRKQARSPNPANFLSHQNNQLIPEEATQIFSTNNNFESENGDNIIMKTQESQNPKNTPENIQIKRQKSPNNDFPKNLSTQINTQFQSPQEERKQRVQKMENQNDPNKLSYSKPEKDQGKSSNDKIKNKKSPERLNKVQYDQIEKSKQQLQQKSQQLTPLTFSRNQQNQQNNYSSPQEIQKIQSLKHNNSGSALKGKIKNTNQMKDHSFMENSEDQVQTYQTQDLRIQKQQEFERRNAEYLRKKQEKIKIMQEILDREATFQPKIIKKRRSLDSRNKNQADVIQSQKSQAAGERLYEQGRQQLILKDEITKIQGFQDRETLGRPEINRNTYKILELKTRRTGESYIPPQDKNRSCGSGSRINHMQTENTIDDTYNMQMYSHRVNIPSPKNSNEFLQFQNLNMKDANEKCPFSINEGTSEFQSNLCDLYDQKFNQGKNGDGYNALAELQSLRGSNSSNQKNQMQKKKSPPRGINELVCASARISKDYHRLT
ncbi:UNKNOWN [Stylonychia lemnae]|uniref:Uncharacterized protein n=1 Tax=Stylonychia lemnae TaxID=5949 RepID=A0A078AXY9_STYLE|nr:UNKNOWN [Stylonychia lemnae]|eukprot:CDW86956.1 UNKNOWN [Stylonychia lemnae]